MNKMTIVMMAALMAVLFVSGCANNTQTTDTGAGDAMAQDVSNDISDAESTDTELVDADVENLDTEFENIDW